MKIAILSDIHGNFLSLKAVIKEIKLKKITKIVCLGDYINYYYEPDKCIDLLRSINAKCIMGNHDNILPVFLNKKKFIYYEERYGSSVKLNNQILKKKHLQFLKKLKKKIILKIDNLKIIFAHGSPWNLNTYIYPNFNDKIRNRLKKYHADFIFLGHTHIPMSKKINKKTSIINAGSIGQPRNGSKNALWAILNTKNKKVQFMETKYNHKKLINDIKKYGDSKKIFNKYFLN